MLPDDVYPKAREWAGKALEIDGKNPLAHLCLAVVNMEYDWDWPEAEKRFNQAIILMPNKASLHATYSAFLTAMGQYERALAALELSRDLNPLAQQNYKRLIVLYSNLGNSS